MKKSTLSILAVLAWGFGGVATAQTAGPDAATYFQFLAPGDRQTLGERNELVASGTQLSQMPYGSHSPFWPVVRSELTISGATVAQEGLYLFSRPSGDALLKIYNALNSVASMEGVQYYSLSQKKMETLILASWRVSSADNPQKLPDPTFTAIPEDQRAIVFQKDNRLGDGYSTLDYRVVPGGLSLTITNITQLKYLFVPLVSSGDLEMVFLVVPLADKVAVYAGLEAKTASVMGLEHSKDENFRNRLRALVGWLGQRIASVQ